MCENRVLRRIFGPKRDNVTGNGENYVTRNLMICTPHPTLSDQIAKSEMGGVCSTYGGTGEMYKGFWWGIVRGKKPLGRSRRRRKDNIKMDPQEVGCGGMDWIDLAQDRDK